MSENYDLATLIRFDRMNIFYLDHDPAVAARAHCDRHVVKMILESAQLLSTAWHVLAPEAIDYGIGSTDPAYPLEALAERVAAGLPVGGAHYLGNQRIYGATHVNHPSAVWARNATGNYDWLWRMAMNLLDEYTFRYGRAHATRHVLRTLEGSPPRCPDEPQTEPPAAMPDDAVILDDDGYVDAVASYRNYYLTHKRDLLQYTKRAPPDWAAGAAKHKEAPPQRV